MRYIHNRTSFAAAVAVFISFSVNVVAQEENLKHTSTETPDNRSRFFSQWQACRKRKRGQDRQTVGCERFEDTPLKDLGDTG